MVKNFIDTDHNASLVDPFNRNIDYLRISVTDRCDFRCVSKERYSDAESSNEQTIFRESCK